MTGLTTCLPIQVHPACSTAYRCPSCMPHFAPHFPFIVVVVVDDSFSLLMHLEVAPEEDEEAVQLKVVVPDVVREEAADIESSDDEVGVQGDNQEGTVGVAKVHQEAVAVLDAEAVEVVLEVDKDAVDPEAVEVVVEVDKDAIDAVVVERVVSAPSSSTPSSPSRV